MRKKQVSGPNRLNVFGSSIVIVIILIYHLFIFLFFLLFLSFSMFSSSFFFILSSSCICLSQSCSHAWSSGLLNATTRHFLVEAARRLLVAAERWWSMGPLQGPKIGQRIPNTFQEGPKWCILGGLKSWSMNFLQVFLLETQSWRPTARSEFQIDPKHASDFLILPRLQHSLGHYSSNVVVHMMEHKTLNPWSADLCWAMMFEISYSILEWLRSAHEVHLHHYPTLAIHVNT